MKKGILAGGNWIIDQVKIIDTYPKEENLVNISCEYFSNGGAAYNVLKALSKLHAPFPLAGIGLVGNDERGEAIIKDCEALNINADQVRKVEEAGTSYTDVMSVKATGKRTFFHSRGANDLLGTDDFDFTVSGARIFHLGYLLLLEGLDKTNSDDVTGASVVLQRAKANGFITSADIVSEHSDRFVQVVPSSLPYIDYLFVNEYEAGKITGIETVSEDGQILYEQCYAAACRIIGMGVKKWVVLHFPGGVIAVNEKLVEIFQPGINLPAHKIGGTVGAGDAFAAGVLLGVHEEWGMEECLELGVCAAASSLFEATSSDGILPYKDCLLLEEIYGYKETVRLVQ